VDHRRLLRLRRASGCLGTSRSSSRDSSHLSSSSTSPTPHVWVPRHVVRPSSTTSPMSRVRVPRHIMRLVTRLIVDYFDYAARPGAAAHLTAHHATRRAARRRLLLLRRASGCLGMSCGSSRSSSSTTSPRAGSSSTTSPTPRVWVPRHVTRLVVENFDHAARPGASARRAAHHATRRAAYRCLLRLRRTSGCLGMSRDSSRGSSSTTSPTPHVWLLRHVAQLVA
jgi:hypothetical protein